jgi:Uncharacterized conserved protein
MEKLIIAQFFIKPENVEDFKAATKDVIKNTREEEGNVFYYLYQSVENPSEFIFYEKFKDQESINFHIDTEHYKKFESIFSKLQAKSPQLNIIG